MKCAPEVEASADGTASAPTAMHRSTAKKSLRMFYLHKRISAVRLATKTVDRVHATTGVVQGQADGPTMDGDHGDATKRDSNPQKKRSVCPCSLDPYPRTATVASSTSAPALRAARRPNNHITVTN